MAGHLDLGLSRPRRSQLANRASAAGRHALISDFDKTHTLLEPLPSSLRSVDNKPFQARYSRHTAADRPLDVGESTATASLDSKRQRARSDGYL